MTVHSYHNIIIVPTRGRIYMRIISTEKLYDYNYSIEVVNAVKQFWKEKQSYSCMGHPKEKNVFLCFCGCKGEYTLPDKTKVIAKSGDIVYAPIDYEYSVRFFDFEDVNPHTIKINFFLYDENGKSFALDNKLSIIHNLGSYCTPHFLRVANYSESAVRRPSKMKSALYEILSALSEKSRRKSLKGEKFERISEGINYLEHDTEQKLSVGEIAALCNVSEIYFRKLFKEYSGMSPVKFRIKSKIENAKLCLEYENMTVQEISDYLGFVSPAYFTRQFREFTGMTPSEYKSSLF